MKAMKETRVVIRRILVKGEVVSGEPRREIKTESGEIK
jgi:hypothetical protein